MAQVNGSLTLYPTNQPIQFNCTWPCPSPDQYCVVDPTTASFSCRTVPANSSVWIWGSPADTPYYKGQVNDNNTCAHAPRMIGSYNASFTENNKNGSLAETFMWPPADSRTPFDQYLGACNVSSFCSPCNGSSLIQDCLGKCVKRFPMGSPCNSTNQCLEGTCVTSLTGLSAFCTIIATTDTADAYSRHIGLVISFTLLGSFLVGLLLYHCVKKRSPAQDSNIVEREVFFGPHLGFGQQTGRVTTKGNTQANLSPQRETRGGVSTHSLETIPLQMMNLGSVDEQLLPPYMT